MGLYPNSGKEDIIKSYVAASSLEDKDYVSAIEALRSIEKPTAGDRANLQKALLLRSVDLINSGGYRTASPLLEEAAEMDNHDMTSNVARYYLADCQYNMGNYKAALAQQNQLLMTPAFMNTDLGHQLYYNVAYTHFKLGDYSSAANYFDEYLSQSAGGKGVYDKDAGVRLGDSYFMQSKYSSAAVEYERVAKKYTDGDLYPWYQASLAYGLAGNESKKQAVLESTVQQNKQSPLYMASLYELGRSYVNQGKTAKAKSAFNEI
ncbi:MAG: tetratricopeptide repeat protein, partial [Bacteroidales bacterium]|nr:tetratricopeptide repeat protein [Bacteroidales bacterium]